MARTARRRLSIERHRRRHTSLGSGIRTGNRWASSSAKAIRTKRQPRRRDTRTRVLLLQRIHFLLQLRIRFPQQLRPRVLRPRHLRRCRVCLRAPQHLPGDSPRRHPRRSRVLRRRRRCSHPDHRHARRHPPLRSLGRHRRLRYCSRSSRRARRRRRTRGPSHRRLSSSASSSGERRAFPAPRLGDPPAARPSKPPEPAPVRSVPPPAPYRSPRRLGRGFRGAPSDGAPIRAAVSRG
jgi:hypothetical protein